MGEGTDEVAEEWLRLLTRASTAPPETRNTGHVHLNVRGLDRIVINEAPAPIGATLVLEDVGSGVTSYSIELSDEEAPATLEIVPGRDLEDLDLGPDSSRVRVVVHGRKEKEPTRIAPNIVVRYPANFTIAWDEEGPTELALHDGDFKLGGKHPPDVLLVVDSSVVPSDPATMFALVRIQGEATFPSGFLAGSSHIENSSRIGSSKSSTAVSLGELMRDSSEPTRFCLTDGLFSFASISGPVEIRLGNGNSREAPRVIFEAQGESNDLTFVGSGEVQVLGAITDVRFGSGTNPISLNVRGQVFAASGQVNLEMGPEAVCVGDRYTPLEVHRIKDCKGGLLDGVGVYWLEGIGELTTLEQAESFSPWFPPRSRLGVSLPWRDPRTAFRDRMILGGGSAETIRQKQAHFWNRMAGILENNHAGGTVQSEVRWEAARARRRALRWGRERFLLSAYSLIGYGERIFLPLLWLFVLAGIATPILLDPPPVSLSCERWDEFGSTFGRTLLSPLAFFRFVGTPDAHGPLEHGALLTVRIAGLLLLFFALAAIRRVTKAE
jgi:hypothetical protein